MGDDLIGDMFKPYLRGGSISYEVDLSSNDCGCVAGVYLVNTSADCGHKAQENGDPQCPSIDIMQANPYGFNVQAHPCSGGSCDAISQCDLNMKMDGVEKYGEGAYGPGGSLIDSTQRFNVWTEFVADADYTSLWKLRTTVSQDGNEIVMEADCGDYLKSFDNIIEGEMGFVFSSWDNSAGKEDFECEGMCPEPSATCDGAVNTINNFKVFQWNSNENREGDDEPERIIGDVAENVSLCGEGCTACNQTWMSDTPDIIEYQCTDDTLYKYGWKCWNNKDQSKCGEDDICHWSWPHADPAKSQSLDAACRPIPDEFIENDFQWGSNSCRNQKSGLCRYGCAEEGGICQNSWINGDPLKWKSASMMCRCMPASA